MGSAANVDAPEVSAALVYVIPVSRLVRLTLAPGTTSPEEFRTVPVSVLVSTLKPVVTTKRRLVESFFRVKVVTQSAMKPTSTEQAIAIRQGPRLSSAMPLLRGDQDPLLQYFTSNDSEQCCRATRSRFESPAAGAHYGAGRQPV